MPTTVQARSTESRPPAPRTFSGATTAVAKDLGRLVLQCGDRPGIIAAVSQFLADYDANIVESDQATTDPESGRFFLRMTFRRVDLTVHLADIEKNFELSLADKFEDVQWQFTEAAIPKRVAIMASKTDHCVLDLLWRARRGELPIDIGLVVSNHPDLAQDVRSFGVPFVHIPVDRKDKAAAEEKQLQLLSGNFDLVVMARYMQILSADFLDRIGCPVINIHHSFLPAFAGAGPYEQAKGRGVKLIGATAHYATQDLDEGPIIEQDVVRVSHALDVAALTRRGADVERAVLTRAVQWHCEDRVLRYGNSTVVFAR
ncbi:formyltetrahydrofolate deformylase [Nocardia aurea]|uniref:formyltetrahydrofolate deformylase n=1 Tax=Nocardia aurea TaxID=2144174 RepID=UPI000D69382B|nr:formyltetrahydrofolate deformylase [Nocardia aurea]